jgi:hypothetical protein
MISLAAVCSEGAKLRGHAESLEVSLEWSALDQAEAADRNFLLSQIDATESQLLKLQELVAPVTFAGLQVSASPVDKNSSAAAKPDVKAAAAVVKKSSAKKESPQDLLASLHLPAAAKGLMGKAALAPMLGMLKGLYEESKQRISDQNVREEKSKKWFAGKEAEHKAKMASIEGKFQNHTLSEEFRTNETRDENRYFNYWSRCRERQHRQFHTNLKIQHGMMTKVKGMIGTYEKALSPKANDQQAAKKQLGQMTGMPEIVFLQETQRTVSNFCTESLAEVRKERAELKQDEIAY